MLRVALLRRAILIPTAFVLLVVIAYTAYWNYAAARLRDQLQPWSLERAQEGYAIHWDRAVVRGFPGTFRFDFTNLTFGTPRPLPLSLQAASASIWTLPWDFKFWHFSAPSGARLVDADNIGGVETAHLDGTIDIGNRVATLLDVTMLDLSGVGLAEGVRIGDIEGHLEVPTTPPKTHTDTALIVSVHLGETSLPRPLPGFGNDLPGFAFTAEMKGVLPRGPVMQALARWRDDGGTVELQSLRLRWSSLLIDASGTLALDQSLQPEGALSATITGQDAAVDVAVMTGALKREQASAAKAVLSILTTTGETQGDRALTLPITVQDQKLFLGPTKITDLPAISWR